MHARVVLGVGKGVLFREVSSVQELKTYSHSHTPIPSDIGIGPDTIAVLITTTD